MAFVTDNAKNMVNAVGQLSYIHIGCAAHTLLLSVNKVLKDCRIDNVLVKVRKIVGHVRHSPANFIELKTLQKKLEETEENLVREI